MASNVKTEVVWLQSHEEIVIKQEKDDPLETETWKNTPGYSHQDLLQCKKEETPEMHIKEEFQEHIQDEDFSSFTKEHVNHPKFQINETHSIKEDCEEVNSIHSNKHPELIVEGSDSKTKYFKKDNYKEYMECGVKRHDWKKHNGEKRLMCTVCNKKFNTKQILIRHVRIHTGEKPFSCDLCDKQFTEKGHLTNHRRRHTGEKLFSCDLCDKQFTQRSTMASHRRIHTGEKPFSCDLCHKQFTQKSTMTGHRRIHTGENPFSCDLCDKQFTGSSALTNHRRIHTGEKPFLCDICHKQFTQKSTLISHRRTHTGE